MTKNSCNLVKYILTKECMTMKMFVCLVLCLLIVLGFKSNWPCKGHMTTFPAFTGAIKHQVPFYALFQTRADTWAPTLRGVTLPSMTRLSQTEPVTFEILLFWAFFRGSFFLYCKDAPALNLLQFPNVISLLFLDQTVIVWGVLVCLPCYFQDDLTFLCREFARRIC